jgi:hypothetical protein
MSLILFADRVFQVEIFVWPGCLVLSLCIFRFNMSGAVLCSSVSHPRRRGPNAPLGILDALFEMLQGEDGCIYSVQCKLCGWHRDGDPHGTTILWRHLVSESHSALYRDEERFRNVLVSVWTSAVRSAQEKRYVVGHVALSVLSRPGGGK